MDELEKCFDLETYKNLFPVNPDFEGYSRTEINILLKDPFGKGSPLQLVTLLDDDYKKMPIINQTMFLAGMIKAKEVMELTSGGSLTPAVVSEIVKQRYFDYYHIQYKIKDNKRILESDSMPVILSRELLELGGLVNKKNNKLSISEKGEKSLKSYHEFFKVIFHAYTETFEWCTFHPQENKHIGQMGFGYSLLLLNKYGNIKRMCSFYAIRYFAAFPKLMKKSEAKEIYNNYTESANDYYYRTFDRFLSYFGLIEGRYLHSDQGEILKTSLFDKLIKCKPPAEKSKQ